jgi:glucokinase
MALGEAFFGLGRGVDNLMFIYGSRGVGAGLVVDRGILRGIGQGAGEIGHTYLYKENGFDDETDCCSTLEDLISVPAIVREARALAGEQQGSDFSKSIKGLDDYETVRVTFQLAREEDKYAQALVRRTSQFLGLALVNVINLTNPELIILGGIFAEHSDLFIPILREMADSLSFANIGKQVEIRATNFGWKVGLVGAGALALANFFYMPPSEVDLLNNKSLVESTR